VGIERVLHRRAKGARVTERSPHVEVLLQLRVGAKHHNVAEDVAARSHSLDHVSLHTRVSIDAKHTRAERGAADHLHVANGIPQLLNKGEHAAE
jgi:hypothetical protein